MLKNMLSTNSFSLAFVLCQTHSENELQRLFASIFEENACKSISPQWNPEIYYLWMVISPEKTRKDSHQKKDEFQDGRIGKINFG